MAREKELKKIDLKEGNISLILDSYQDLFSNFDPRSYSERALSQDFLEECRRAVRDIKEDMDGLELRLLVPKSLRDLDDEVKIKKRFKAHFQKHFEEKQRELVRARLEGAGWFIFGVVISFFSTFIFDSRNLWIKFLFVILEPAGWFTIWNGLDKILFNPRERKAEFDFYRKMAKLQIYFNGY